MDLRQLRYFVTVAEELHFSRASARLHLAQSALSSQIRALERELGGPLLVRTTRRVQLTPAGEALLEDGRRILAACDDALTRAGALARGEAGRVVIGFLGPAPGGVLAPLLAQFGARHPEVLVEVRAVDFVDSVTALRERRVDIVFNYAPIEEPDIEVTPLVSESRVVVLPASHPLASREFLSPADLAGETFVTHPDPVPERWRDFWMLVDQLGERPPTSIHTVGNIEEWLLLIGRGEGVDTCPAVLSRYFAWPEVAFVPLVDAPPATLVLLRLASAIQPLAQECRDLAVMIAETAASNAFTPYAPAPLSVG